ncbi:unnamed protein product [marine sediment metagenome]|uniref:Uncharacterized protein n=1 Tax=marine sediment metagenome TaxID=412755 RepID=X1V798_9ZZZZ
MRTMEEALKCGLPHLCSKRQTVGSREATFPCNPYDNVATPRSASYERKARSFRASGSHGAVGA